MGSNDTYYAYAISKTSDPNYLRIHGITTAENRRRTIDQVFVAAIVGDDDNGSIGPGGIDI